ncbi:Dicer-like protein 1 [Coemansia sp. BCRC 34301]|nr:Dicer-like protein 1 [Coemansia sp. BCRC 34301]
MLVTEEWAQDVKEATEKENRLRKERLEYIYNRWKERNSHQIEREERSAIKPLRRRQIMRQPQVTERSRDGRTAAVPPIARQWRDDLLDFGQVVLTTIALELRVIAYVCRTAHICYNTTMLSWPASTQDDIGDQSFDYGNEVPFADPTLDDTEPLLPSGLQPREYQLSLFRRALQDNAIVMLETGTGKTLVAVMLIQWFAQRAAARPADSSLVAVAPGEGSRPQRARRKIRVFLNNTVALAHQQARVIAQNSSQRIKELVGHMSVDEWDEARWAAEWEEASVLVMTHQVLLNALRAGLVRISDIDLLVFDECHHARGHHPYALIMREFYDHCSAQDRPHIFGMTASPLNSRQSASESAMYLQAMLDSSICTVDLTASPDAPSTQPKSLCYEYALPPEYAPTALTLALAAQCSGSAVIMAGLKVAPVVLSLLGPFGVDQMWHHCIHQWHRKMRLRPAPPRSSATRKPQIQLLGQQRQTATKMATAVPSTIDASAELPAVDISEEIAKELQPQTDDKGAAASAESLDDAVYLWRALAIDHNFGGSALTRYSAPYDGMDIDDPVATASEHHPLPQLRSLVSSLESWGSVRELLSPQVNRLLGILHQWQSRPHELRGIVFTNRRLAAVLLVYIISRISEFSFIRADVLLGASQKTGISMNRPIRNGSVRTANQLTLADFASGRLNLIFATQVAEEGVDVQPCNVVVRFDMPNTATSLIQSRGRARMCDSQFIVMVPEMDSSERGMAASDIVTLPDEEPDAECRERRWPTISEHARSFTDYLKLVNLEKCIREWCLTESKVNGSQATDGVMVAGDLHAEYGRLLRQMRVLLVVDNRSPSSDIDGPWVESRDATGRMYIVKATQARITYSSAVSIVHRYVQMLPQDLFCTLAPVFEFESVVHRQEPPSDNGSAATTKKKKKPKPTLVTLYRCKITLPANAALRQVAGPLMPNKKLAKQVTAYRVAKKLHQLGAIDDNLVPANELSVDDLNAGENGADPMDPLADAGQQRQIKGTRSSVSVYETAVPEQFTPPLLPCALATLLDRSEGTVYQPFPWHLYLVSLKHPDSPDYTRIILATARQLPENTKVPLFTEQFASSSTEQNHTATMIEPLYVGSQVLSGEQVDSLASFSSKLLVRVICAAQSWEATKVGVLLAPPLLDGSGIDFGLVESMFSDRSSIYQRSNGNYAKCANTLAMDGLDFGKLKVIERACKDVNIYSNLSAYHYGVGVATDPVINALPDKPPSTDTGTGKNKVSVRYSVQKMVDWAGVKCATRMLRGVTDGHTTPLFKLRPVLLTQNYLAIASSNPQSSPTADFDVDVPGSALLASNSGGKLAYPDVIYSSPYFCVAEPIDLAALNSLSLLPSFFVRLGHVLTASNVKTRLGLCAHVETVRQAITASSANLDTNYERLEILGDSVLKLISTTMLFVTHPDDHEGHLTQRRNHIVSNSNLFKLAHRLGLAECIISRTFNRREQMMPGRGWQHMASIPAKWVCAVPPSSTADGADASQQPTALSSSSSMCSIESCVSNVNTQRQLSDKAVADVIEAILGATVIDGGYAGALAAARSLGVVGDIWSSWSEFGRIWRKTMATRKDGVQMLSTICANLAAAAASVGEDMAGTEEAQEHALEAELDRADVLYSQTMLDNERSLCLDAALSYADTINDSRAEEIESILGYQFKDRSLLAEAMTHCSSTDLHANSYQRLEFLGDAVLDYFITRRYHDYQPKLRPHRITLVKHVACSNDLFGLIMTCHGLHRFVRHSSTALAVGMRDYELRLDHARQTWVKSQSENQEHEDQSCISDAGLTDDNNSIVDKCSSDDDSMTSWSASLSQASAPMWSDEDSLRGGKRRKVCVDETGKEDDVYWGLPPECWNVVHAPKVLGDVFESLLGAMYVDFDMDMAVAEGFYQRILSPFLDRFVDSGRLSLHPVIQTLLICQGWGCNMVTWDGSVNPDQLDYTGRFVCEVRSHGVALAAAKGDSLRHAKFNVASVFLGMIEAMAPNALHGDLSALRSLPSKESKDAQPAEFKLDRLLKPVCTCMGKRRAEAEAEAGAVAAAVVAAESEAAMDSESGI